MSNGTVTPTKDLCQLRRHLVQHRHEATDRSEAIPKSVRLASDFGLAPDGSRLPQSAATLGIHVDSFVRYLSQPEMADLVEGAITN